MFLLFRRSCAIYRDFAQYCQNRHISVPKTTNISPSVTSRRLMASPELASLKMLSPFAPMRKMSPLLKNSEDSHSVLLMISAKKDEHEDKPKKAPQKFSINPIPSFSVNEENKVEQPCNLDAIKKSNHTSICSQTTDSGESSPIVCTEVIHRAPHNKTNKVSAPGKKVVIMCGCGNECQDGDKGICPKCNEKLNDLTMKGYLYEKSKLRLNRFWYVLIGDNLYRYKSRKDKDNDGMYSLTGCYIKDEKPEQIQKNLFMYPLLISFGSSKLVLYAVKPEEQKSWTQSLKKAIGYSDLTDFYELGQTLGTGKFGSVKRARCKETGTTVAVKIIKKSKLSFEDLALAKREIEIMRVCQHPNIVGLLDTFENSEYIYIVLEVLEGGDLFEYLEKRQFKINEARARSLIHSIATALYYLHSYGIVHRDIKLENILMTDTGDNSQPKLMDFGLSKMIGPSEVCDEPLGTLGYIAPEILHGRSYDKSVDIWSLGVVLFICLTGHTPFDAASDEELSL